MRTSSYCLPLILASLLTGCATANRATMAELREFRIDCQYRDQQLSWLRSQMPSQHDRQLNALMVTGVPGTLFTLADETYHERRLRMQGYDRALIAQHIRNIESMCP